MLPDATRLIHGRPWHRVRFERNTRAINDTPVALIPDENHPTWSGVGLANAGSLTIALDRHTLLLLTDPALPDTDNFPASTLLAKQHNRSADAGVGRSQLLHERVEYFPGSDP